MRSCSQFRRGLAMTIAVLKAPLRTRGIWSAITVCVSVWVALGCTQLAAQGPGEATPPGPPGILVDLGGRKLHAIAVGEGSPAVVMISGVGDFGLDWARVEPEGGKVAGAM